MKQFNDIRSGMKKNQALRWLHPHLFYKNKSFHCHVPYVLPLGEGCPLSTSNVQDIEVANGDPLDQGIANFEETNIDGQYPHNDERNFF